MPACPGCGRPLSGTEATCPACGRPTDFAPPPTDPSPRRSLQSLPLGDYFRTGWELFKQYPGGFIGFSLVYAVVLLILPTLSFLGWLLFFAVYPPLVMGNFMVSAKLLQGQPPAFRDFFAGFHFFLPLVLLSLVTSILIAIGLALLIIPGIYLIVAYLFAACLVIDRRLDFWPAMELSRRTVTPMWFGIFTFTVLLTVVNILGALLLGLGLLVTVPLTYCALTAAYADLFGLHSDYTQEVPRLKSF
jgi:uncharacterized membrane protein